MIPKSRPWRITFTDRTVAYTETPTRFLASLIARDAYKPVAKIGRVRKLPEWAKPCHGVLSEVKEV